VRGSGGAFVGRWINGGGGGGGVEVEVPVYRGRRGNLQFA
jgi:hypothetical protein